MSYEKMKKAREAALAKLVGAAEATNSGKKNYDDDRLWAPAVDKQGNGYAVIRFLPQPDGEDLPWARYWDHGFKGSTGRWYIEKSLTSLGQDDPVSQLNSKLWNSGIESDKDVARLRKRRLHYVSNVLIVSDPANPENEGQIRLFKYGKKIFDKIMDVMQPQFQDEKPINPFDLWEGANFRIKIRNVEGYRNYDKSEFDSPSELYDGDERKLKETYDGLHSLAEFTDPTKYKTYDELKRKLIEVLGEEVVNGLNSVTLTSDTAEPIVGKTAVAPEIKSADAAVAGEVDTDDEDNLSFFAKLARGE
jgi:hypothetical protein